MNKALIIIFFIFLLIPLVLADFSRGPTVDDGRVVSRTGGGDVNTKLILSFFSLIILTFYVGGLFKKNSKKYQSHMIFVIVAWMLMFIVLIEEYNTPIPVIYEPTSLWEEEMVILSRNVDQKYLFNDHYLEIDNPIIQSLSNDLGLKSDGAADYVQRVLSYVSDNVRYVNEDDEACFEGTATSILSKGTGQCDTQSIVVLSLLRAKSIPSRIVGGCLNSNPGCGSLMGFLELHRAPLNTGVIDGVDVFGRGLFGIRGLHAFPQVMLPVDGVLEWFTLEATSGEFADTKCYYYYPEIEDVTDKEDICVSRNKLFADACGAADNDLLRRYGGPYVQ